jgi:hypothetical protein
MGTPFTDLAGAGSVEGWEVSDNLFLESTIRGRSRRWTPGSTMTLDARNTFTGFGGQTALFVPTAMRQASPGRCQTDCCVVEVVMGVHP